MTFVVGVLVGALLVVLLVGAARPAVRVDGAEHLVDAVPPPRRSRSSSWPELQLVRGGMPPAEPAELALRRARARQTHPGKRWRP